MIPSPWTFFCNAEVIDIDQDVLGKHGCIAPHTANEFILAKPVKGDALAVGLFTLSMTKSTLTVKWD